MPRQLMRKYGNCSYETLTSNVFQVHKKCFKFWFVNLKIRIDNNFFMKIYKILDEETFHILLLETIQKYLLTKSLDFINTPAFYDLAEILNLCKRDCKIFFAWQLYRSKGGIRLISMKTYTKNLAIREMVLRCCIIYTM